MKTIALPVEHGGWGFLSEPIVLALLVAPSGAGFCYAVSAIAAFLFRHPFKIAVSGNEPLSQSRKRMAAARVASVYLLVALIGLVLGIWLAGYAPLVPLLLLSPLVLIFVLYDTRKRSRRLFPELVGPLALAGVAPAVALAGGWSGVGSAALWLILLARTIPSIMYVRARLRLERAQEIQRFSVIGWHIAALMLIGWLVQRGLAPYLTFVGLVVLLTRAALGLSEWRQRSRATRVGFLEIGYGLFYVLVTAVGFHLGV